MTYKDFGITGDEELEYTLGNSLSQYFWDADKFLNIQKILEKPYLKLYYGVYPMVLSILNFAGYYEWYHLLNMLFASIIIVTAYLISLYVYKDRWQAVIPPVLILLMPQFLGHIPANPKDMPFAVFYFLAFCLVYFFNKNKTNSYSKILILGVVLGFTQSLRIIGYTIYIIYLLDIFINKRADWKLKLLELAGITFVAHLIMLITYPYLRQDPTNLIVLLSNAKSFISWDRNLIYFGQILTRDDRPWHYLFVYLLLTTPLVMLFFHLYSFRYFFKDSLLKLTLITIYLNLFLYLVLNPIVYNGLRHFLYLLPLISLTAAISIMKLPFNLKYMGFITIAIFLPVIVSIIKMHPYEYVYFNPLAHRIFEIEKEFETDYWGMTYKEATGKVVMYIDNNQLVLPKVYPCNLSFAVAYYSQFKFEVVNKSADADIIICDTENDLKRENKGQIVDTVQRSGMILNYIRLNDFDK